MPEGGDVTVSVHGDIVEARVSAPVRPLAVAVPHFTVDATAAAALEPGVSGLSRE
jgi:hypothetical protein